MDNELDTFDIPGHKGVRCEHCKHVGYMQVERTTSSEGFIMRERLCPKCGKINETSERSITARDRRRYTRSLFAEDDF